MGVVRKRHLHVLAPFGSGLVFGVHARDVDTAARGLLERVFFHREEDGTWGRPVIPPRQTYSRAVRPAMDKLIARLGQCTPMSDQEFLDTYRGPRRRLYEQAVQTRNETGVTRRHARINTFVKAEKLDFTNKPNPAPRVIQPRDPVYNAAVGPYIKRAEKRIMGALKTMFGAPTVFKGMNADAQAETVVDVWNRFVDPVALGLDAKRWDEHYHIHAIREEHRVYKKMYSDPAFAEWLSWQMENRGVVYCDDGTIHYTTTGRKMSGDMNTGCGNCVTMCILVYSFMTQRLRPRQFYLLNNGDDCVIILERSNLPATRGIAEWYNDLGFPIELEPVVDQLEKIEFCQTQPVYNGTRWTMCRNPRVCVAKDCGSLLPMATRGQWDFARGAVAACGQALAGDLPVLGAFYRALGRGTQFVRASTPRSGMEWLAIGMNRRFAPVTDAARVSFFKAFDFTPSEQLALEGLYDSATLSWDPSVGASWSDARVAPDLAELLRKPTQAEPPLPWTGEFIKDPENP